MAEFRFEPAGHEYHLGRQRLFSVTQMLTGLGMYSEEFITEADYQRGQAMHQACHYFDLFDLDWDYLPRSEELLDCAPGYITNRTKAWESYRHITGFVPVIIERSWYDPNDLFAGTPDRFGYFPDGTIAQIELKSGVVQEPVALQTWGYDRLFAASKQWQNEMRAALEKAGLWRNQRMRYLPRIGLQLRQDGKYTTKPFNDMNDNQHFLDAWNTFKWGRERGMFKRRHDNGN